VRRWRALPYNRHALGGGGVTLHYPTRCCAICQYTGLAPRLSALARGLLVWRGRRKRRENMVTATTRQLAAEGRRKRKTGGKTSNWAAGARWRRSQNFQPVPPGILCGTNIISSLCMHYLYQYYPSCLLPGGISYSPIQRMTYLCEMTASHRYLLVISFLLILWRRTMCRPTSSPMLRVHILYVAGNDPALLVRGAARRTWRRARRACAVGEASSTARPRARGCACATLLAARRRTAWRPALRATSKRARRR